MAPNIQHQGPDPIDLSREGTLSNQGKTGDLRILINGEVKIIPESFAKSHPGGRVIYEFDNKDATDVFNAFHGLKGHKSLEHLKKDSSSTIAAGPGSDSEEVKAFRQLLKDVAAEGLMKSSPYYYTFMTLSTTAYFGLVAWICFSFPGQTWAIVLASLILGLSMSQCGWLTHDYLHHQVFANRAINNNLGLFLGCVLQGFSPTWWKNKHNTHHAVCNVHGADPDIDTVPLVAWSSHDFPAFQAQTSFWKTWIRNQTIMFPLVLCLAQLSWRLQSVQTALAYNSRYAYYERATILLHYIGLATMTYLVSNAWTDAALFLVLQEVFGSYGKAVPFVLNHGGCPVVERDENLSYFRLQVLTSRDVHPSFLSDFFMGGLNYQIEHHIFPTMPRHNLGKVKAKCQALAKKFDIPYVSVSFGTGMRDVLKALSEVSSSLDTACPHSD